MEDNQKSRTGSILSDSGLMKLDTDSNHDIERVKQESYFHKRLLKAVNAVSIMLIAATPDTIDAAIQESLKTLGQDAGVDRAYIWDVFELNGRNYSRQLYEWSEGAEPQQGKEFTLSYDLDESPFWKEHILSNTVFNGPVKNITEGPDLTVVKEQGIMSMMLIPIQIQGRVWGYIGFDDCKRERTFTRPEEQVLRSAGVLMISAITANDTTQKLMIQNKLRRAVNQVSLILTETNQAGFKETVRSALRTLGECTGAGIVSIWRCASNEQHGLTAVRYTGCPIGLKTDTATDGVGLDIKTYLPIWENEPREDINIYGRYLNERLRDIDMMRNCKSLLLLPLIIQGAFWGFIAFDHHDGEYLYSEAQRDILRLGGMLIASAVIREEINENLVEARKSAEEGAKAKSEFLSRMSHEIRTPLNVIIGLTELSKKSADPKKTEYCLGMIDSASHQLLEIINDVLDMSKIDADKLEIAHREFNFEEMLHHVINVMHVKFDEKKFNFVLDFPHKFSRGIISDRFRLSQVLINLLGNSVKFTPAQGTIMLKIGETGIDDTHSTLHMEVIDTGIGIADEQLESIFQAFVQADVGNTRQYGGTGLGLTICKKIVTLMGGKMWAESTTGSGSRFIVEIEVEWGRKLIDEVFITSEIQNEAFVLSGKTILLAEDIEINREIVSGLLEDTGVNIEYAENGVQAVEMYKAASQKYDLIFMDVQMPILDGLEATRQIRSSGIPGAETVPIIAMTANAFKEDVQASLDAGLNGHITKPIDIDELFGILKDTLQART